jgi:hypothetical protein
MTSNLSNTQFCQSCNKIERKSKGTEEREREEENELEKGKLQRMIERRKQRNIDRMFHSCIYVLSKVIP